MAFKKSEDFLPISTTLRGLSPSSSRQLAQEMNTSIFTMMLLTIFSISFAIPSQGVAVTYLSPTQASSSSSLHTRESKFARLKLPLGVSIEVPKNWRILDGDMNSTIETAAEAMMNLSGIELPKGEKVNLFRANSMPTSTYASIAINATDSEINPADLRNASKEEIADISSSLRGMMQKSLSSQHLSITQFYGVRREFVGRHPALVIEYKRSGERGDVIVQMTRLFLGSKEISLNLSYRESEAAIWKPIVQYIRKSLSVL